MAKLVRDNRRKHLLPLTYGATICQEHETTIHTVADGVVSFFETDRRSVSTPQPTWVLLLTIYDQSRPSSGGCFQQNSVPQIQTWNHQTSQLEPEKIPRSPTKCSTLHSTTFKWVIILTMLFLLIVVLCQRTNFNCLTKLSCVPGWVNSHCLEPPLSEPLGFIFLFALEGEVNLLQLIVSRGEWRRLVYRSWWCDWA